jgi:large subunit ribosomal protein L25
MSQKIVFAASPRSVFGKKTKLLRKAFSVPANITGDVEKSVPISVSTTDFAKVYDKIGDSGLVYLKVEGEKDERPVLVSEVQEDPITEEVLHVMFRQVNLNEKVSAEVPVKIVGELAVRNALVVTIQDTVEVEALPQDLPEKFEIDISQFTEFGQSITFNQLNYDHSKVELLIEKEQLDTPIILVQEVKEEVEEAPVAAAPIEGAAPAAGDAATTTPAPAAEEKKE